MRNKYVNHILNFRYTYLLFTLFFALSTLTVILYTTKRNSSDNNAEYISYNIDIQLINLNLATENIVKSILKNDSKYFWENISQLSDNHLLTYNIYSNNTLRYWSTHTIDQVNPQIFNSQGDTILQLNDGIYLIHQFSFEDWKINLFKQIQSEFIVENSLLETQINNQLISGGKLSLYNPHDPLKHNEKLIEKEGIYKLIYTPEQSYSTSQTTQLLLLTFQLLFFLFLILWLNKAIQRNKYFLNKPWRSYSTLVIITIAIRWCIEILIHKQNHSWNIFAEVVSPIPYFETAGDMITNLFIISILLFILVSQFKYISKTASPLSMAIVIYLATLLLLTFVYNTIFQLILNNEFVIEPEILFKINSAWKILTITFLSNAIAFALLSILATISLNKQQKIKALSVAVLPVVLINLMPFESSYNTAMLVWFVATLVLFLNLNTNKFQSNILSTFFILLFLAGFSAYEINHAQQQKTKRMQEFTATMLAQKNDPLMEYQLTTVLEKIQADSTLINLAQSKIPVSNDSLEKYIKDVYMNTNFTRYNVQITICDSTDFLDISDENELISCHQFFRELVTNSGDAVDYPSLYNINTSTENIYYLGEINFDSNKIIFLEFVTSYVPEGIGYPELLIDQKAQTFNLSNTSYARYYDNTLGYKFGEYKYPIVWEKTKGLEENNRYFYKNKYQHFKIYIGNNESIIVSVPKKTISEILFPFSILFLLFTISVSIAYLFIYFLADRNSKTISFRTKLQLFIIVTIIFTSILLALITLIFMQNNANLTTQKQLEEKSYSVYIELQHKLKDALVFSESENMELENLLKKFSLVFFSDINLYTPEGRLAATSRPEMEQKGLLSNMINPEAYKAIMIEHQLSFITKEQIGKLSFYSAYLPLFLSDNKPAAIINLPFFARQSEIVQTFAALLANFINIAVLIAIIGTIFSILLARLLTKPLLLLQQRMANVEIDRPNQTIFWKNNDEIGQLIAQYNQMVEKLEVSAELLKDSERENTWREMARQIAHEIKNPLTPMKLNVQYLEKAYQENYPDFQDRLTKTTKSLIEQIETLNNVAEMFGEIAASRIKTKSVINVGKLISGVVEFFDNTPEINFVTQYCAQPCFIKAVEKDMIRVMNNLIKNAVQSFTNQPNKTIKVECTCENNKAIIIISDNGKGIPMETQQNIFRPYFTTKTSGTGLGLAIAKSIVGENNGRVSFESTVGKGSTFTLYFPIAKV